MLPAAGNCGGGRLARCRATITRYSHLYDASGQRLAQVDGPSFPPESWLAGDLVVSRFALPEGGAVVRAGVYAYPSLDPVAVLDANGNPAGQWIDFPP